VEIFQEKGMGISYPKRWLVVMSRSFLGKLGEAPVVMPIGPVAYWWDTDTYKHWDRPEHWHYVAWRERVNDALIEHGCLVYRHWEAFKGTWNNRMQAHNNRVLEDADIVINMKPDYAWSDGTDEEIEYATLINKPVINAAPPKSKEEFAWAIKQMLEELDKTLGL
jgi:hypothetical protein